MENIRSVLFRYRDAKCHLWNVYFCGTVKDLSECEPLYSFEIIDMRLFFALVCHPLEIEFDFDRAMGLDSIPAIVVKPRPIYSDAIPVMVSDMDRSWNKEEMISTSGLSFAFIEFFQWDSEYDYLSLPMVKAEITECQGHPEYQGREALIEICYVDVFLADAQ